MKFFIITMAKGSTFDYLFKTLSKDRSSSLLPVNPKRKQLNATNEL